jgi:hypothetical protein
MPGENSFLVEDFINSITTQLDRVQDSLRIKAVNRPLTYALKDLSLELKVFAELDEEGNVRFRTARANEAGASVVNLNFTTITKPMIEENTISLATSRSASLDELGLKPDEQRRLEQIGVRNLAQLNRLQSSAGLKALERIAVIPAERLRLALSEGKPRVTAVAPVSPAPVTPPPSTTWPPPQMLPPQAPKPGPRLPSLPPAGPERPPRLGAVIKFPPGQRRIEITGKGLLNLDDAPVASLNGQALAVAELDHDRMVVDLPPEAQSGTLAITMPQGEVVTFAMDIDSDESLQPPLLHSVDEWAPEPDAL